MAMLDESSPRLRGCSLIEVRGDVRVSIFPAPAGVFPS